MIILKDCLETCKKILFQRKWMEIECELGGQRRYESRLTKKARFRKWSPWFKDTGSWDLGHETWVWIFIDTAVASAGSLNRARQRRQAWDYCVCAFKNAVEALTTRVPSVSPLQVHSPEAHWADFTVLWHQSRHEEGVQTCQDVYESISYCWRTRWFRTEVEWLWSRLFRT